MTAAEWRACTDDELTLAATLGELAAYDELVRRFRPAVVTVARRIVGGESAEDVAQDALLLAFKALPQLEEPERFGAWLYAITRHRALRFREKHAHQEATGPTELDLLILQHTPELARRPEEDVERDESRREVRESLGRLPEPFQVVLQLHYFEGMPVERIAAFLDLTVTTVKWRMYQGRQMMKRFLEGRWRLAPAAPRSKDHDRRERQRQAGAAPPDADAERHQQDRPRRQPHRAARGREGGGGPPV